MTRDMIECLADRAAEDGEHSIVAAGASWEEIRPALAATQWISRANEARRAVVAAQGAA
jgi:hypothetical protein